MRGTEKKMTLVFEAGKAYRTRDWRKFICLGTLPNGHVVGYVEGSNSVLELFKDGSFYSSDRSGLDLVDEWKEPPFLKQKLWVFKNRNVPDGLFVSDYEEPFSDETLVGSMWVEEGKWADPEDDPSYIPF